MKRVICPVCLQEGTLQWKETITIYKGKRYSYKKLYVYHHHPKPRWCYLTKQQIEALNLTQKESTITQNTTQNVEAQKKFKSKNRTEFNGVSPGSIARSSIGGCRPPDPGSNPGQGAKFSQ